MSDEKQPSEHDDSDGTAVPPLPDSSQELETLLGSGGKTVKDDSDG